MTVFIMRNVCSSERQKVTKATILMYRRSLTQKKEKNYAPFLYHVGISRNEKINKIRKTCTRRLWTEQKQEGSVLLTRFATGSESRPQVQAVPSLEQA